MHSGEAQSVGGLESNVSRFVYAVADGLRMGSDCGLELIFDRFV